MEAFSGWFELPSVFPELRCFGIHADPLQYVITVNTITGETVASVKQYPNKDAKRIIGTFNNFNEAREVCAEHWIEHTGGKNADG